MIQLHHGSKPLPTTNIPNVRRVVYNRLEDIPWLLKTDGTSAPNAGLRAEARPFIPTQIATKATQLEEEEEPAEDGKKKRGGVHVPKEWPWEEAKKLFEKPDVLPADEVEVCLYL